MGSVLSGTKIINPMAQKFIQESIANQRVVIFSKSYCPYCTMAKEVSFWAKIERIREISKLQSVTHRFVIFSCFCFFVAIQEDKLSILRCRTGRSRRLQRSSGCARWAHRGPISPQSLHRWKVRRRRHRHQETWRERPIGKDARIEASCDCTRYDRIILLF